MWVGAGRRNDEERTFDRRVPAGVREQHGQRSVDVEPNAGEPVVRVRIVAERVHHVAAEQPSDRGRYVRAEVRQGSVQQLAGDSCRPEILRGVHVLHEEHTRRKQLANRVAGSAQAVQSVAGQIRRRHGHDDFVQFRRAHRHRRYSNQSVFRPVQGDIEDLGGIR